METIKQKPTASRLLQKVSQVFDNIEAIRKSIDRKNASAFSVTFYHDSSRNLIGSQWSDQFYGASDLHKDATYIYVYEITSRGISFRGFTERDPAKDNWWSDKRSWYAGGSETSMALIAVPNLPPCNSKTKTMYLYHQEKIKETLSALPAWAILCGADY